MIATATTPTIPHDLATDLPSAAMQYARAGWRCFPCREADKAPLTRHGCKDATADPATVLAWWNRWPTANIGLAMGAGVVAVDLDGDRGEVSFAALEAKHGPAPATLTSTTGRGRHLLFACPAGGVGNTQSKLGPGIDTRGDGGYIIVAPSVHPTGAVYEWATPGQPMADLPDWLNPENVKPAPVVAERRVAPAAVLSRPTPATDVTRRASAYLACMPEAVEGSGGHSALYAAAAALVHGFRMSPSEAEGLLASEFNPRCSPPWDLSDPKDARDFRRKTEQAHTQPHHQPRGYLADEGAVDAGDVAMGRASAKAMLTRHEAKQVAATPSPAALRPIPLGELLAGYPKMRPPVIEGLLRQGETANVIAAPKTGKSWLVYDLALSAVTGGEWLGRYRCEPGNVLLVDNELHRQTLASRIPRVAAARGIDLAKTKYTLDILPLRGLGVTLDKLHDYIEKIEAGHYKLIILDAFYRFIPPGASENSNADTTALYNKLDSYASRTKAAWVVIHHSSKGEQGGKAITDVGAGAGSQSRAADAHIVLRPHDKEGHIVLDAAVRSFQPVEPMGLRWDFPTWNRADDIDARELKGRQSKQQERNAENVIKAFEVVRAKLAGGPMTPKKLREASGFGKSRMDSTLEKMVAADEVVYADVKIRGQNTKEYRLV